MSWGSWKGNGRSFTTIGGLEPAPARGGMVPDGMGGRMSQTARFQETLRRLAIFDEGFVDGGVRA